MATSPFDEIARAVSWLLRLMGGIIAGLWLIFLFVGAIALAALSLSAIQLRDQLNSDGKGAVTFEEVEAAHDKYVSSVETIWRRLDKPASDLQEELWKIDDKINGLANALESLKATGPVPDDFRGIYYENFPDFITIARECAQNPTDPGTGQTSKRCTVVASIEAAISEYDSTETQLEDLDLSFYDDFYEQQARIQAAQPLYKHFSTFAFFDDTRSAFLLKLPRQVLVLLLTMSMGLLGSVVTMTWSFVRNDSGMTVQRFAVLPIVGMTTAFVVLVFINAGQMTLTAGTGDTLNPFALSFVGIISGLLSERAYGRLSDVGNNFFATADAQLRWANHLGDEMDARNITAEEIARHLGLPEAEIERIVTEEVPATLDQQRLIAACMRMPLRDLFTDAPPPDKANGKVLSVVVPSLISLDAQQAEQSLRQVGLTLGKVTKRSDARAAPGAVVGQSPTDGMLIARSAKVDITVSTGPGATAPGDDPTPDAAAGP